MKKVLIGLIIFILAENVIGVCHIGSLKKELQDTQVQLDTAELKCLYQTACADFEYGRANFYETFLNNDPDTVLFYATSNLKPIEDNMDRAAHQVQSLSEDLNDSIAQSYAKYAVEDAERLQKISQKMRNHELIEYF